jgi:ribosomal protein L5
MVGLVAKYCGVIGTTGDSSGNLSFGLGPEEIQFFPEIEVNFDVRIRSRASEEHDWC